LDERIVIGRLYAGDHRRDTGGVTLIAMAALDAVPRIDPPGMAAFIHEVLAPPRTVVIRDLYRGDPIAAIRTAADAIAAWGDVRFHVEVAYTERTARHGEPQRESLESFLGRPHDDPATRQLVIVEQPTPAEIRSAFTPPEYVAAVGAWPKHIASHIFVAHAGQFAHMHYHLDGSPVLLTQVFGRKWVWLVPPEHGQRLDPRISGNGHWSSLFIENLSGDEKRALALAIGGHECVLEPGDTLVIPSAWWHYVDYLDTGMSFNIHVALNQEQRALRQIAERLPARHLHYWQGITQLFGIGREPTAGQRAKLDRVVASFAAAQSGRDAVSDFGDRLVDLYREASPDGYRRILHRNDLERARPVDELADAEQDPVEWRPDVAVVLAPGIELGRLIARSQEAMLVLNNGQPSWRIETTGSPEPAAAVLEILSEHGGPIEMADLVARLAWPAEDVIPILDELTEIGILVPATLREARRRAD
jgi:hypothetical protein